MAVTVVDPGNAAEVTAVNQNTYTPSSLLTTLVVGDQVVLVVGIKDSPGPPEDLTQFCQPNWHADGNQATKTSTFSGSAYRGSLYLTSVTTQNAPVWTNELDQLVGNFDICTGHMVQISGSVGLTFASDAASGLSTDCAANVAVATTSLVVFGPNGSTPDYAPVGSEWTFSESTIFTDNTTTDTMVKTYYALDTAVTVPVVWAGTGTITQSYAATVWSEHIPTDEVGGSLYVRRRVTAHALPYHLNQGMLREVPTHGPQE